MANTYPYSARSRLGVRSVRGQAPDIGQRSAAVVASGTNTLALTFALPPAAL